MTFSIDQPNDGVAFELEVDEKTFHGTITIEALQDHFDLQGADLQVAERFCSENAQLLTDEIAGAIRRHPPFGADRVLILPHHLK